MFSNWIFRSMGFHWFGLEEIGCCKYFSPDFERGYLILGGFDCHFLKLFILKYTTFEVLGVAFLSAGVAFLVVGVALDLTGVVGPRPGVIVISFEGFETNDFCFEASLK